MKPCANESWFGALAGLRQRAGNVGLCLSRWCSALIVLCAALSLHAEPLAVNVGSSEASLFWQSAVDGQPEVRVFTDAAETVEITSSLRREAFPLAEPPSPFRSAERRGAARDFRESIRQRGLMFVRVGPLEGGQTYYLKASVRDDEGTLHPVPGNPVEVKTAPATGFVADYRKAAFVFGGAADAGSVALLTVDGARSPLLAVVGDASGAPERGVFSLAALVDDGTGEPMGPGTGLEFEVSHYQGISAPGTMSVTGGPGAGFQVAGFTSRTFEVVPGFEVAYFEFDPVGGQMAGQPFMVRVTARTAANAIAADFEGTVAFSSDGRLETGAGSAGFTAGVLDAHPVVIGNTGDFQLMANNPPSGASGVSQTFAVRTDWENWQAIYGDPSLDDQDIRLQRLADPDGLGMPGLLRYAFDLSGENPAGGSTGEISIETDEGEQYGSITFRRLQYGPDVRYVVQGSDDLENWAALHVIAPGSPEWVTAYDKVPLGESGGSRFLRIQVVGDRTYDFWKVDGFPVASLNDPDASGRESDPGELGLDNFSRYALGMDPDAPDLALLPTRSTTESGGQTFNTIQFQRLAAAADVRYVVEATSDFSNWELVALLEPGEPRKMTVQDPTPVPENGSRFLRLRIEQVEIP